MTDTDIFNLWDRERALRQAGKWPDGAPSLILDGWSKHGPRWHGGYGAYEKHETYVNDSLTNNDYSQEDAALWRIVQFVAWDSYKLGPNLINKHWWYRAKPDDWIAEAAAILTRLENH